MSSASKGKDGDILRTTMEALQIHIGAKCGEEAAKEFATGKKIVQPVPTHDATIITRHATRVVAEQQRLDALISSLMDIQSRLDQQIALDPTDVIDLKIKKADIDDQLAKAQDERGREMEVYLTPDEKALHSIAF